MKVKQITEKSVWEDFVINSGHNYSFFQSWNWGEFERVSGKSVERLGFFEEEKLVAIAQVVEVKARRGSFIHVRNGPICDWSKKELVSELIEELKNYGESKGVDFIRISPLIPYGSDFEKYLKSSKFVDNQMHDVDAEITWVLDISQSDEILLENMRKNTRYSIRRAEKDGVKIVISKDVQDLPKFFKVYQNTVERQKWHAYGFEYLKREFEIFAKDDQISIFLAEYQGVVIAASLFIYYGDTVYYHHSGSLTEYQKIPASYLIQWESIKESKRRKFINYNFFGIAREDSPKHPWYGLSFFKKGFGGREQRWIHAQDLPLKPKYWLTYFYEFFERRSRGY